MWGADGRLTRSPPGSHLIHTELLSQPVKVQPCAHLAPPGSHAAPIAEVRAKCKSWVGTNQLGTNWEHRVYQAGAVTKFETSWGPCGDDIGIERRRGRGHKWVAIALLVNTPVRCAASSSGSACLCISGGCRSCCCRSCAACSSRRSFNVAIRLSSSAILAARSRSAAAISAMRRSRTSSSAARHRALASAFQRCAAHGLPPGGPRASFGLTPRQR